MAGYTTETGRISNEQFVALSNRMTAVEFELREIKGMLKEVLSEKVKSNTPIEFNPTQYKVVGASIKIQQINESIPNATPVSIPTRIQALTIERENEDALEKLKEDLKEMRKQVWALKRLPSLELEDLCLYKHLMVNNRATCKQVLPSNGPVYTLKMPDPSLKEKKKRK